MFLHTKPYGHRRTSPMVEARRQMATDTWSTPKNERLGAARSGLTSEYHFVTTGTPVSTVAIVDWSDATVHKGFAVMMMMMMMMMID